MIVPMLKTIEKQKHIDVILRADQGAPVSRLWDMDVEQGDREAIDHILEYLIQSGSRPAMTVTGDIVEIVTALTTVMQQSVPSHLSVPLKIMMDYLARWLCDYVDETGATVLRVAFGFDASLEQREKQSA